MEDNYSQASLFAGLFCLMPFLILSIIAAIRTKSFRVGFWLILLFTVFVGIGVAISLLYQAYWPEGIQRFTTPLLFIVLIVAIIIQGVLFWLNARNGGKILHQNKGATLNIVRYVILVSFVPIFVFLFLMNQKPPLTADIFLLWGIISIVSIYRSIFEIREKGFISQGKAILFSDIEHAEWENLLDKTKLKIQVKSTGRILMIKTPWDLITPIDDYIKTNFPRP